MKTKYSVYKRKDGKIRPLTEAEQNDFDELEIETSGNEPEETVGITKDAIAKLLEVDCSECDPGAVAQTLFDLAEESGRLTAEMIAIGEDDGDEDHEDEDHEDEDHEDEDLEEDDHEVFSRMRDHLTKGKEDKEFKDSPARRPSLIGREGKTDFGRFNKKSVSTGTQYSRVMPDDEDYEEPEDDQEEDTPKRGRGRPAGASNKDKSYKPWSPEARQAFKDKLAARRAERAERVNETEEDDEAINTLRAKFKARRAERAGKVNETEEDDEAINALRAKFKYHRSKRLKETTDSVSSIRDRIRAKLAKHTETDESLCGESRKEKDDISELAAAMTSLHGE